MPEPVLNVDPRLAPARWAASGGMALTGESSGPPLVAPGPVAGVLHAAGRLLPLDDAPALVGERGVSRRGSISCGGATRLLRCEDAWLAVALPRPTDLAALPAWLGIEPAGAEPPWGAVAARLARMTAVDALEGAQLLEVPCSAVGERDAASSPWVLAHIAAGPPVERPFVVDLSSLWAGPLCGDLLQRAGAEVVKVEDPRRPDAARSAPPPLFDLLNGAKQSVAADLSSPSVHELLRRADVVISSARPRAFAPLGIDVPTILSASPTVWVAITAHGWSGNGANRVGFGDDAAAAAGLVAWPSSDHPVFVADAVADPLCGTLAAVAALSCLEAGGSWLIDAALVSAAAYTAGLGIGQPTVAAVRAGGAWLLESETVAAPRARRPLRHAPPLGSDTASVLAL